MCLYIFFSEYVSLSLSPYLSPFLLFHQLSFFLLSPYLSFFRILFSLSPFLPLCLSLYLSCFLLSSVSLSLYFSSIFFDSLFIFNHFSGKGKGIGRFNGFGNSLGGPPDEKSGKRPPNGHQGKPSPSDADTTVQTDFTVIRVMSSQG